MQSDRRRYPLHPQPAVDYNVEGPKVRELLKRNCSGAVHEESEVSE
jgi:hypothetical protein